MTDSKNNFKLYVPVYTLTLILSAFLLFGVQPLFSKMILPRLGGSASVWNTAMVFFQAVLLCGYLYAHLISKYLPLKLQVILHLVLFGVFSTVLPLSIPDSWTAPEAGDHIALWQLSLMTVAVGGPFFILSGCAPLLQRWFARTDHPDAHNPYFLYAASNFGSMTALLTYPLITEPLLTVPQQSLSWSYGYGILAVMIALCALVSAKKKISEPESGQSSEENTSDALTASRITTKQRLGWLLLAFVPSSLMLGVTSFITTDIASAPLLWVVPLALYVGTFIFAFARKQYLTLDQIALLQGIGFIIIIALLMLHPQAFKLQLIIAHLVVFFLTALLFHTKLVQTSPPAEHLTEFYVFMSLGGVLGGMFNALLAPVIFIYPIEYILILAGSCLLRFYDKDKSPLPSQTTDTENNITAGDSKPRSKNTTRLMICLIMMGACVWLSLSPLKETEMRGTFTLLIIFTALVVTYNLAFLLKVRKQFALIVLIAFIAFPTFRIRYFYHAEHISRNYFGVSIVTKDVRTNAKMYFHGTTVHGIQSLDPIYAHTPLAYYYVAGNEAFYILNNKLEKAEKPEIQDVAVVGLGAGTLACFDHPLRHFDLYEIDQDVIDIASTPELFTYLSDCKSEYEIFIGDGRLEIEKQDNKKYDLIYLDVFSSDNIPVHIVTKEAFAIYLSKLKDDGAIIINISNRYLDLVPVLHANAKALDTHIRIRRHPPGFVKGSEKIKYYPSVHAILTKSSEFIGEVDALNSWNAPKPNNITRAWTDDYANIISSIVKMQKNKAENKRKRKEQEAK